MLNLGIGILEAIHAALQTIAEKGAETMSSHELDATWELVVDCSNLLLEVNTLSGMLEGPEGMRRRHSDGASIKCEALRLKNGKSFVIRDMSPHYYYGMVGDKIAWTNHPEQMRQMTPIDADLTVIQLRAMINDEQVV